MRVGTGGSARNYRASQSPRRSRKARPARKRKAGQSWGQTRVRNRKRRAAGGSRPRDGLFGFLRGRRRSNNRVVNNNTPPVNNNNPPVNSNKKASYNVPAQLPDQLKSWRQTNEGNCASVACIKAAVDRFDDKVFKSVNKTEDGKGYDIQMRDGYKLNLSQSELNTATNSSRFRKISGDNGLTDTQKQSGLDFANLAYAAMAKRAANERFKGVRSFKGALNDFENGYYPPSSAKLLGLEDYVQNVNSKDLGNQDSVTAWNGRHAIFVDRDANGKHFEDNWGKPVRYDRATAGARISGAFTFKPDAPEPPPTP